MDGAFEILEILGSGAHSTVCVVRRVADPDAPPVALKVLKRSHLGNAGVLRRFRDEARILIRLDHPGIVGVSRLLDYDGRLVQEMAFVSGATLEDLLEAGGPVPWRVGLAVVRAVACALEAAHNQPFGEDGAPMRIVHRDLKPANVMISESGEVKLLDFGVAKGQFGGREAQSLHNVWGTVGYDAPERRNQRVDTPASDVYALGVTLFVLLSQRPLLLSLKEREAHDGDRDRQLAYLSTEDGPTEAICALLKEMVVFRREDRLGMVALIARLDALLNGEDPLEDFARGRVAERVSRRMAVPATQHPEYSALRFLEERQPSPPLPPRTAKEASLEVRRFLDVPDWETRIPALERLLGTAPCFLPQPFLDIVARATVPSWKFWVAPARPEEVEAALLLLAPNRSEGIDRAARALLEHRDERIANAAAFLLKS